MTVRVIGLRLLCLWWTRGVIDYISPDALAQRKGKANSPDATYYRALIRADVSTLKKGGQPLSVIPGMTATAGAERVSELSCSTS